MILLWVVLFILVVAISFVLAARSMKDFTEIPTSSEEYSLFLIRKTDSLTAELLNSIHKNLLRTSLIISFERLFKGKDSALVVFGSSKLLMAYKDSLDLLELEDYTNVDVEQIFAWEVGIKKNGQWTKDNGQSNLSQLSEIDQFWWQVVLSNDFKAQITAVVISADAQKRNTLTNNLQSLSPDRLIKLPKAFSNEQLFNFYKSRSFRKDNNNPILSSEEIIQLFLPQILQPHPQVHPVR